MLLHEIQAEDLAPFFERLTDEWREREPSTPPFQPKWGRTRGWGAESTSGSSDPQYDRVHPDGFEIYTIGVDLRTRDLTVGTAVQLKPGEPPAVHLSSGRRIGTTSCPMRHLLQIKLEDRACVAGILTSLGPEGRSGILKVACFKHPAAAGSTG